MNKDPSKKISEVTTLNCSTTVLANKIVDNYKEKWLRFSYINSKFILLEKKRMFNFQRGMQIKEKLLGYILIGFWMKGAKRLNSFWLLQRKIDLPLLHFKKKDICKTANIKLNNKLSTIAYNIP